MICGLSSYTHFFFKDVFLKILSLCMVSIQALCNQEQVITERAQYINLAKSSSKSEVTLEVAVAHCKSATLNWTHFNAPVSQQKSPEAE